MVTGIVIPADAYQPIERREFASLEDYQLAVGGWIEPVDLRELGVTIYVSEEGLRRHLPFNSHASFLWWYHVAEARQRAMLVGDAVIVGLPNRQGNATDVPPVVADQLTQVGNWRVQVLTHGDPKWYGNQATYDDYFEALIWAMLTLERWSAAEDVRVVPVPADELADGAPPPTAA